MNDRELLELAAKAAGYDIEWKEWVTSYIAEFRAIKHKRNQGFFVNGEEWNPLTNDGDALRLAVKLNLHAMRSSANRVVCCREQRPFDEDIEGNDAWTTVSDCWFPLGITFDSVCGS